MLNFFIRRNAYFSPINAPGTAENPLILLISQKTCVILRKLPAFQHFHMNCYFPPHSFMHCTYAIANQNKTIANQNKAPSKFLSTPCKSGQTLVRALLKTWAKLAWAETRFLVPTLAWTRPRFSKTCAEPGLVCIMLTRLLIHSQVHMRTDISYRLMSRVNNVLSKPVWLLAA